MYIISKIKDYYDGVVGTMGVDKSIVYVREPLVHEDSREFPNEFRYYNNRYFETDKNPFHRISTTTLRRDIKNKYERVDSFIIGFCGKLYIGWKLHYNENETIQHEGSNPYTYPKMKTNIVYDIEEAKKYIQFELYKHNFQDDIDYVLKYNPIQIFRDFNTPVFVFDMGEGRTSTNGDKKIVFIVNPILKDYQFYNVIDSFTAFQEIQMFLSGVLGCGEKEITEVADKYKITQHGFDYKYSFRKEPQNKK